MLTPSSTAIVIPFEATPPSQPKMGFAQATKTWLDEWNAERGLNTKLCVQIFLHFNEKHFEETGELLAWPGWDRLAAKTGLSRRSVAAGLQKFEQAGALKIEHGRYNHEKKRRDGNFYWGKSKVQVSAPSRELHLAKQGAVSQQDQGAVFPTRLGDKRLGEKERKNQVFGNSTKQEKQESSSTLSPPNSNFLAASTPRDVPRAPPPGGSPGDEWVPYESRTWDHVERLGFKATGKVFVRYGRVAGAWIPKSDLKAIEVLAAANGGGQ
jgi:hypothetical protein